MSEMKYIGTNIGPDIGADIAILDVVCDIGYDIVYDIGCDLVLPAGFGGSCCRHKWTATTDSEGQGHKK